MNKMDSSTGEAFCILWPRFFYPISRQINQFDLSLEEEESTSDLQTLCILRERIEKNLNNN